MNPTSPLSIYSRRLPFSRWHRVFIIGLVDEWPPALPRNWLRHVQSPETEAELTALRRLMLRGPPFGEMAGQNKIPDPNGT